MGTVRPALAIESGGVLVADKVKIALEIEAGLAVEPAVTDEIEAGTVSASGSSTDGHFQLRAAPQGVSLVVPLTTIAAPAE